MKTLFTVLTLLTLGFGTVALTAPANASRPTCIPPNQNEGAEQLKPALLYGAAELSREESPMIATILIVVCALAIAVIGRAALDPQT